MVFQLVDGALPQVVVTAVVDIEIDIPLDAWQATGISMLPELPGTGVLHFVDIVVGYPARIAIEPAIAEIFGLKFIIGIDDGLHVIAVLDNVQPCENVALEIFHAALLGLMLHIEHGWKVALLKMYLLEKIIGLLARRRLVAPEMIGTANEAILACLIEIVVEVFVHAAGTLGGLDHDKAQRLSFDGGILQFLPVDVALIVADVDAMNHVSLGVFLVAIEGTPAKARGSDEEIVERPHIERSPQKAAYPPCP